MVITFVLTMFSRKIFLDELGAEFIGLTTTLLGIIGFLSLAEMGLSGAVAATLYKPLAEKNYSLINTTIDFLGKAYKVIGLAMFALGSIVALFLPHFFPSQEVELSVIYFAYVVFITSVIIEYVFNYKQIILSADQKNYVLTYYRDGLNIVKVLLQILAIKMGMGVYVWLFVGLLTGVISIVLINRYIHKYYKWLNSTGKSLKNLYLECGEVVTKTKNLMIHQVGYFVFRTSDSLLIYKFSSLVMVTLFSNYQMLSAIIQTLFGTLSSGLTAGVGSYISSKSNGESYNLFQQIFIIHLIMALFFAILFYKLSDGFILLWLGDSYLIHEDIKLVLSVNIFLMVYRGAIDVFIMGGGIFHDVKAPVFEVVINLIVSITAGYFYGVAGVLLGTLISVMLVAIFWKSYLIYTHIFLLSFKSFSFDLTKHIFLLISVICPFIFYEKLNEDIKVDTWLEWIKVATFYSFGLGGGLFVLACTLKDFRALLCRLGISEKK